MRASNGNSERRKSQGVVADEDEVVVLPGRSESKTNCRLGRRELERQRTMASRRSLTLSRPRRRSGDGGRPIVGVGSRDGEV